MRDTSVPKSCWGKIVHSGMGGFLAPPRHPEHYYSVQSNWGSTFFMSLSSAVECDWLDGQTKSRAKNMLKNWDFLPLEHPEVEDWIYHVLGYYKHCYWSKKGDTQNTLGCLIKKHNWNPMKHINAHAGVCLIREYYPKYTPIQEDFNNSYWGKKEKNVLE